MGAGIQRRRDQRRHRREQRRPRRLVEDTRDRVAAELAPRGGLLPPEPEGWFDVTLQVMEAHLADARHPTKETPTDER